MEQLRRVAITGTGSYLPEKVLTNAELEKMVETSDEWILTRTGIRERHIARDDQPTSDMCVHAAERALAAAGVTADKVGMIIVATATPDMPYPNTACLVQARIGAKGAFCMDLEAACSGFLYALEVGRRFVADGTTDVALVIGGDKMSCITDWQDRGTCILFGDAAGAAVLQAAPAGSRGILGSVLGSDGTLANLLQVPAGGSLYPASAETLAKRMHYQKMAGNEVFKHAVRCMTETCERVMAKCGVTSAQLKLVIPHQANLRIISAIADRLNAKEKFYINLERVGNTSAATVPVALDEAVRAGRVAKGDLLLFVVFGAGFTWGATILEW